MAETGSYHVQTAQKEKAPPKEISGNHWQILL
jgi:hypothetical protein